MKKVLLIPVYDSFEQAQEQIKNYNFVFAYKVANKYYYLKDEINIPKNSNILEVPWNEIYIEVTGLSDSISLTYIDDKFLAFNELV
jgi:hypothetical protein